MDLFILGIFVGVFAGIFLMACISINTINSHIKEKEEEESQKIIQICPELKSKKGGKRK